MQPSEIRRAWAAVQPFYEPLLRDPRYLSNLMLTNPVEADALGCISDLMDEESGFFSYHDYCWTIQPAAYDQSIEPLWQERLLSMLAVWWGVATKSDPRPLSGLNNLVVRVVYDFDVRTGAPLTPPGASKPTFILMPLGFLEQALLFLHAASSRGRRRTAGLRALILKALAADLVADAGDTRQLRILELRILERAVPLHLRYFKGVTPYVDGLEWTDEEGDLSYAVVDFVLAHEAAHALAGHSAADLEYYVTTETEADRLALDIYGVSYGRRLARIERSPLARPMALLGGAPIFFAVVQAMDRLRIDLYDHLASVELAADWQARAVRLQYGAELFKARAANLREDVARRTKYFLTVGEEVLNLSEAIQLEELIARISRLGEDARSQSVKLGPNTLREFRKIASLLPQMVDGPVDLPTGRIDY